MAKQYAMTATRRLINSMMKWLARRGWGAQTELTTTGSQSGAPRSVPVSPVEMGDRQFLVSPYGEVAWVRNVRANPQVRLRRGKSDREVTLVEVPPSERGELLAAYWNREKITRPYFDVPPDARPSDFLVESEAHPVFEVVGTS